MFDSLDATTLARTQFAFTMMFHIIFPAFSIGLASYLAVLEGLWLKTGKEVYLRIFKYWLKIFAVVFAMGVVSGIVMSYQFGTNWSVFSDKTGPILGPLMAYEILVAFFLEAGFLGVMLFGMNKVGKRLHFTATLLVAIGTLMSAFWILSVNSWMQTPAGYGFNDAGQFIPEDWIKIVFNPSFPYRLVHMVLAAYLTTAFAVGAVAAYHLLADKDNQYARVMFSMAMWMAAIVAPIQLIAGDLHGLNTLKHQPAKIAALEGHFETQKGAPLILFGIPDMDEERTKYALQIPYLGSLVLTHSLDGKVSGLKEWKKENRPDASIIFWTFRIMVGLGVLMILTGLISLFLRWRGRLYVNKSFYRFVIAMGPSGFIAVVAGWITTEVGRQPYTVYGVLRTAESISVIEAPAVAASLSVFLIVYLIIFSVGTMYILNMMRHLPGKSDDEIPENEPIRTAHFTRARTTTPHGQD